MPYQRMSVRALVGLIVIGPVVVVAVLLLILSNATNKKVTEDLGRQIMDSAIHRVEGQVDSYMSAVVRVSKLYARRVEEKRLPTDSLRPWEAPMLDDLRNEEHVASICFGSRNGASTWLLRHGPRMELGRVDADKVDEAREFAVHEDGAVEATPIRTYHYDARERPWYKLATASSEPVWTDVYFWFGTTGSDNESGVGLARSVRAPDGTPEGVLVIDMTLGGISRYLRELPVSKDTQVYIIDNKGLLVATSKGSVNTPDGKRRTLAGVADSGAREVAQDIQEFQTESRFIVDETIYRMRSAPLTSIPGLKWRIVVLMPEEEFLGPANATLRNNVGLACILILGGLCLALFLASRITRPLTELTEFVNQVGNGDFRGKLQINAAKEFVDLSRDLNKMSVDVQNRIQLEHSMKTAMEVQQSLLPAAPPTMSGLEIIGASRRGDARVGDRYDFVDTSGMLEGRTMIVIGEVRGHGVGAALLMATARAAIRTCATIAPPLQNGTIVQLMGTVNRILTRDAREEKLMSMLVAIIDRPNGQLRWSSAGHELPIVFDTVGGKFIELEGNDVLLGLMEHSEYKEYIWYGLGIGQVILLGTDGIWECRNAQNARFGKERLREIVRSAADRTAQEISDQICRSLAEFAGDAKVVSDLTFVVVKVTPIPDDEFA